MSLSYNDVLVARKQAEETFNNADIATRHAARLIAGRLEAADCWPDTLRALKKELQRFNAVTGKWK